MKIPNVDLTVTTKSVDSSVFRELSEESDFEQCIQLQRSVFGLPDTHIISPLFFKLIARKNPPVGIALGAFKKTELIGFIIGFSSFLEKSVYATMLGVKQEYQNKGLGLNLFLKFRESALASNLTSMYCVYDPLQSNLTYLYCAKLGFTGIKLEIDRSIPTDNNNFDYLPEDKLLTVWHLNSPNTIKKLNNIDNQQNESFTKQIPIATVDNMPHSSKILIEIPDNYNFIKTENFAIAKQYQMNFRNLFLEYINNRNYEATDCIKEKINNQRKIYFLLEKK